MKTRKDYDLTEHIGMVYAKIEIELSWSIRSHAISNENQTR